MNKAYPSNLTRAQYEFISDLIPEANDPYYGEAIGITFYFSKLFKHPLTNLNPLLLEVTSLSESNNRM